MPDSRSKTEHVVWTDRGPRSALYDDPYYSTRNGLAEAQHVFLAGNDLPTRFRDGFHIGELGFGTGLNALAALAAWDAAGIGGSFEFTSFEAHPMPAADMERAYQEFPEIAGPAAALCSAWASGAREITIGAMRLRVLIGDAATVLRGWEGRADAWFLDGFAPARNPDMWSSDLMHMVAAHTAPGGSFATFTAASAVRTHLSDAGFTVTRCSGFAHKRHMTKGQL